MCEVIFSIGGVDLISATFWENNISSPGEGFGSPSFAICQQDELHVYKFNFAKLKTEKGDLFVPVLAVFNK